MLGDRRRHDSNWARPSYKHILSQQWKRQCCVHRIAKWVEYGCYIAIHPVPVMPNISHRHGNVFGKRAWAVYSDSKRVFAEMASSGQAVTAAAAHNMTFCADYFT